MLRQFLLKQMLSKQLANVPDDQKQKVLAAIEQNPDFFKNIADAIQQRVAKGEDQMSAIMAVVTEHKEGLQKLLQAE
jgi:hypothetical protein